jgi:hypothetical protein
LPSPFQQTPCDQNTAFSFNIHHISAKILFDRDAVTVWGMMQPSHPYGFLILLVVFVFCLG